MTEEPLLKIENLSVDFTSSGRVVHAVKDTSFSIPRGETLGLVGESGSGKSVSSLATMGLIPSPPGKIVGGSITFDGKKLFDLSTEEMRSVRGREIAMIFQEPMTSLNPVFTIGNQITEAVLCHETVSMYEAKDRALKALEEVGIPNPSLCLGQYPHELSGGMKQRAMIAMAIICKPKLLIADEPTTALDVTIQAQILELLRKLQEEHRMSMLFITHDLGVVAQVSNSVCVMRYGEIVERGAVKEIFANPQHPYTVGLFRCLPRLTGKRERLFSLMEDGTKPTAADSMGGEVLANETSPDGEALLEVRGLVKHFPIRKGLFSRVVDHVKAVDGVSFDVPKGRTLSLVGESGCGKTTTGRSLLRLIEPTHGSVMYNGHSVRQLPPELLRSLRAKMQIIFQDPYSSLNPRMTCGQIIEEGLIIHSIGTNTERKERVAELLEIVGLTPDQAFRYPHEFSGGQRQRIGIARCLALRPDFIVCDEAVSALDVSIQAQIINLLMDLQKKFGFAYLFISHDLSVVRHLSHRVAVMYRGQIVEEAECDELFEMPLHPYTKKLLSAIPLVHGNDIDRQKKLLVGWREEDLKSQDCPFCRDNLPVFEEDSELGALRYHTPKEGRKVKCLNREGQR
jgi:ABC-type glutathione transport system ATPase component